MKESVGVTTGVEKAPGNIIAARFRRSLDIFALPDIGERVGRSIPINSLSLFGCDVATLGDCASHSTRFHWTRWITPVNFHEIH